MSLSQPQTDLHFHKNILQNFWPTPVDVGMQIPLNDHRPSFEGVIKSLKNLKREMLFKDKFYSVVASEEAKWYVYFKLNSQLHALVISL